MLTNAFAVLFLLALAADLRGKALWAGAAICCGLALPLFLTWGI